MNVQKIVSELEAAREEMDDCCERADEREILDTMEKYKVSREKAIHMIAWAENYGTDSDFSFASNYGREHGLDD